MRLSTPWRSERLELRTLDQAAADGDYARWLADDQVLRFLDVRYAPPDRAALRSFIQSCNDSADSLLLGLFRRADGRHIGNVKIGVSALHRRGDLGIIIGASDVWGQGYAAEAIAAATDLARDYLGLVKLTAGCVDGNEASRRAFLRAGWDEEGRQRHHWRDGEAWRDVILLGKVLA